MKSPRHQLVLLGLICQALSWDDVVLPLLSLGLWVFCLLLPRRSWRHVAGIEALLLLSGSAAAYGLNVLLGQSPHFFIGFGLSLVQVARLTRLLSPRDQLVTIVIALVQFGVAATVVVDYRFIPLLGAAVVLAPRALLEWSVHLYDARPRGESAANVPGNGGMETSRRVTAGSGAAGPERWRATATATATAGGVGDGGGERPPGGIGPGGLPRLGWGVYAILVVIMAGAFVLLPRGLFGTPFGAGRGGRGDAQSLEDSLMDPTRSAGAESGRLVMQLQGRDLGYLKCHVFTVFDGVQWQRSPHPGARYLGFADATRMAEALHRRVRVNDVRYLGGVLPADGRVVQILGGGGRRPMLNSDGVVVGDSRWRAGGMAYEYWVDRQAEPERLAAHERERLTRVPPVSTRLQEWLANQVRGETNDLGRARRLEQVLRTQFSYRLGAPRLSRLEATEEFLLDKREGHCERFASAHVVLLRMLGIPSRVAAGFVPGAPDRWTGWQNVRFRDAHAWTEAWFPEVGWQTFDATPRASMEPPGRWMSDLLEAMDALWFAHVISFDGASQRELWSVLARAGRLGLDWVVERALWVGSLLAAVFLWFGGRAGLGQTRAKAGAKSKVGGGMAADAAGAAVAAAHEQYGRLLRRLRMLGYARRVEETPLEFAARLRAQEFAGWHEVARVTQGFCAVWYGNRPASAADRQEIEAALARLEAFGSVQK